MAGFPVSLTALNASHPTPQAAVPSSAPNPDTNPQDPDYEGPENGPFRCDNCTYFQAPSQCSQPTVMSSPTTPNGQVDPAGCCKFFNSMAASGGDETQPNAHPYGK